MDRAAQRDICHLLGGLLLDGAKLPLLDEVRQLHRAEKLGRAVPGDLGRHLLAMQDALEKDTTEDLAAEYTRLFLANGAEGARAKLAVSPWEDCHTGGERQVLGARSQAAFRAYVKAGFGFDGMKEKPSDHIGLELCFVAALLDEELKGERDESSRRAFLGEHLAGFARTVGTALEAEARKSFWKEVGAALATLPSTLVPAESKGDAERTPHA